MDSIKDSTRAAIEKAIAPLKAAGFSVGLDLGTAPTVSLTVKWGVTHETYSINPTGFAMVDCSESGTFYPEEKPPIKQAIGEIVAALNQKEEPRTMDYEQARALALQTTSIGYSTLVLIEAKENEIREVKREVGDWADKISMEEVNIPVVGGNDTERKANKAKAIADNTTIQTLKKSKIEAEKRVDTLTSELHKLYRKHKLEVEEVRLVTALLTSKAGIGEDAVAVTLPHPDAAPAAAELF